MVRSTRRHWLAAVALVVVACAAPTLPLPPPGKPDIEGPDPSTGQVTLRGNVEPRSTVVALNLADSAEGDAQQALDDGSYELSLGAQVGDRIFLYYRVGTVDSQPLEFVVPDPAK